MEKKTKHRILGFIVIIAVVVILFPFLEKDKGLPPQTSSYEKAPPFPVPAEVTASEQPADTIAIKPVAAQQTTQGNVIPIIKTKKEPDQPVAKKETVALIPQTPKQEDAPVKPQPANETLKHDIESELFNIKSQIVSNTRKKIQEFTEVKSSAWVVQLGTFKEKNNAVRLVNQLRANGYHAFMTKNGDSTKVFVGPENKKTSAHLLASRLEEEMHIRGIVVNYKPFTL